MKKILIAFLVLDVSIFTVTAQNVGIGTTSPASSAQLDISSTSRGLQPPRMSAAQRIAIGSPAEGLLVYDTDSSAIMIRSSGAWKKLSSTTLGDLWNRNGNNIYNGNSGNVGIGVSDPLFKLDMSGRILIRGDGNSNNTPGVTFANISGAEYRGLVGMRNDSVLGLFGVGSSLSNNGWPLSINIFTGRTGIFTSNPLASLHVDSGNLLLRGFQLNYTANPGPTPLNGGGGRMFWYPEKAAFRAGHTGPGNYYLPEAGIYVGTLGDPMFWDRNSIGQYSFAAGASTLAKGLASISLGYTNKATGPFSTALSFQTQAIGRASTSLGDGTIANANGSLAIGTLNDTADNSIFNDAKPEDRVFQIRNGYITFGGPVRNTSFSILRNGNVGMGVPNPKLPLHFASTLGKKISLYRGATGDAGFSVFANEMRIHSDYDNADVTFSFDNLNAGFTERVRIKGNGNVGIGTSNPYSKLIVAGDMSIGNSSGTSSLGFNLVGTNPNIITSTVDGDFIISNFVNGNVFNYRNSNQKVLIEKAVRIGSSGTAANLEINSYPDTARVKFATPNILNAGRSWQIISYTGSIFQSADADIFAIQNSGAGNLVSAKGNGNVGIGVDDAQFRLDVSGRMRIRTNPGNSAGIWLNNDANNAQPAFIGMRNDNLVGFYGNGSPNSGWGFLMNTTNGRVGIGTDNPYQALHVIGNILASGTITPSDSRYKKNILPIENALAKLW